MPGRVRCPPTGARIFKRLGSPGIDSEESIPPIYVAWRESTTSRVDIPAPQAGNRFLGSLKVVLWIRIRIHRIHMFLGLPDPDPLVRGMDPRIRIRIHPKISWIRNTA